MRSTKIKKQRCLWSLRKPLLIDRKDSRYPKMVCQLQQTGVSDDETWNLDRTIAMFVLPRLVRFMDITDRSFPADLTGRVWKSRLTKMRLAFQLIRDKMWYSRTKAEERSIGVGLRFFADHFQNLWW